MLTLIAKPTASKRGGFQEIAPSNAYHLMMKEYARELKSWEFIDQLTTLESYIESLEHQLRAGYDKDDSQLQLDIAYETLLAWMTTQVEGNNVK